MLQENELVTLLLGCGVLYFCLAYMKRLRVLPGWGMLFAGLCFSLAGWLLTNLQAFLGGELLNALEHVCYAVSACLVAFWSHHVFGKATGQ